jgi:hypothetical protein
MALSIAGLLSALAGCNSKPAYEDTSALENPPPKPPNCPDLPELKNVTLKDGAIADVRIVQFRDTKLYVPMKWMGGDFLDKVPRNDAGFIDKEYLSGINKEYLRSINPDIHSLECPGTVHRLAGEEAHAKGMYPVIGLKIEDSRANVLIESPDFWSISFALNAEITNSHALWLSQQSRKIEFNDDIVIGVRRKVAQHADQGMRYESQSVLDFTKWLATPPAQRDDEQKFVLKLDKVIKL